MRYIVLVDHGAYTAGQVLDIGDAEAASTLIRTTGVSLLKLADAAVPVVVKYKPKPEPVVTAKPEPVPAQPAPKLEPKPEPKIAPATVAKSKPAPVKGK